MLNKNGIPLYIQLKDKLLEDIKANYKSGDIIPTELQLEKFYKVSKSRNKAIQGFGLGLSIVKNSIELHNGSLLIDSIVNKGTKVTVIF